MKTFKKIFILAVLLIISAMTAVTAQVTIGADSTPQDFSILELISGGNKGLRLPQLDSIQRKNLMQTSEFIAQKTDKAMGLQIFNTDTRCVDTWNGREWIEKCGENGPYVPIHVTYKANGGVGSDISVEAGSNYTTAGSNYTIADNTFTRANYAFSGWNTADNGSGTAYAAGSAANITANLTLYAQWVSIPNPPAPLGTTTITNSYVGAFWKNSQTGERLIRIAVETTAGNLGTWSAVVTDGDFIKLDTLKTSDTGVNWAAAAVPADMNVPANDSAYQVLGNAAAVQGAVVANGYIYFRIGLTSANTGAPRYGRVLLTYNNGTKYQYIYIRQGEEADYVFRKTDPATGTTATRPLAARFSPYNLTVAALPESPVGNNYANISVQASVNGGVFVDYPSQAGAFWQWGTNKSIAGYTNYIRRAYHPTLPVGAVAGWDGNNNYPAAYDAWDEFTGTDRLETCPNGWRRFTIGNTSSPHGTQAASGSELMQSLFYTTFDGGPSNNANSSNYRYFGYYADGFFDRRIITASATGTAKSVVSASTKDAAFIGLLFVNPATNASLFTPAAGSRDRTNGTLQIAGSYSAYWSSSSSSNTSGWNLCNPSSAAWQNNGESTYASCVRCVVAE